MGFDSTKQGISALTAGVRWSVRVGLEGVLSQECAPRDSAYRKANWANLGEDWRDFFPPQPLFPKEETNPCFVISSLALPCLQLVVDCMQSCRQLVVPVAIRKREIRIPCECVSTSRRNVRQETVRIEKPTGRIWARIGETFSLRSVDCMQSCRQLVVPVAIRKREIRIPCECVRFLLREKRMTKQGRLPSRTT
jgi:hypothetical protein